jgi:hypothetical protein
MRLLPNFRRHESMNDYPGVLVPLDRAHLHSHSARSGRAEFEEVREGPDDADVEDVDDDPEADAAKVDANEDTGMLQMSAAEYTIEGLRREVRKDGERGRRWTEYERKYSRRLSVPLPPLTHGNHSQIQAHQQSYPRYWHGALQLAAVCSLWLRLVCR